MCAKVYWRTKSKHPRKQRRARYNAPKHRVHKMVSAHLSRDLFERYQRRSFPVRKNDTVKIVYGAYKGHEGKVARVYLKKGKIAVEGVTITKADGKEVPLLIDASNVIITKLDLSDKKRKIALYRSFEVVEEEGEAEKPKEIKGSKKGGDK